MSGHFCSNCGKSLMPTMRICPECGNKSFSPVQPVITKPAPTNQFNQASSTSSNIGGATAALNPSLIPAGNGRRLLASMIDGAILGAIFALVAALVGALFKGGGTEAVGAFFWTYALISYPIHIAYLTYTQSSEKEATIGKRTTGLRILTTQGERLSPYQAFGRALLQVFLPIVGFLVVIFSSAGISSAFNDTAGGVIAVIGCLAVFIGPFITVFFTKNHLTVMDMICGTRVVMK
jgi:uncharacterized RDD family membrane protein YckC